jgi:hypothetical protein
VPVAHAYKPSTWEAEIKRAVVQDQPGQKVNETPISEITRAKWTGGVAQVVECMLCKHRALSTNPSPTKKKKKKKMQRHTKSTNSYS